MTTNSSVNLKITNNADGFDVAGGTTARKLTLSGADIAVVGSGTAVITYPTTSSTLATLALSEALTNKTINGLTVTASTGTITIANSKTLTFNNTLAFTGTDSTTMTFPTTSATLARTDAANTFTGASTASAWVLTSPTITTKLNPTTDDGAPLGDTTHNWSDLFLASGAVVNIANSNWVATHTSGILTVGTGDLRVTNNFTNATSVVTVGGAQTLTSKTLTSPVINTGTIGTSLLPTSNDGAPLGNTTNQFSDLFLAEGGVINWDNGDVTLTQTGNVLAVAGGDFRIATADVGTNADSVPTISSTNTLTNKTLTAPVINAATLNGTITLTESTSIALDPAQADQTWTGITRTGTAGAALAFGQLVYLAAADSRWELADADAATTADRLLGMVVLAAAADGDPTNILLMGNIQAASQFPAMTIGSALYVGESAGAIQVAIPTGADNVIRRVGYALTADELYFNPSMDSQITVA